MQHKLLGDDHPDIAAALNNLAFLLATCALYLPLARGLFDAGLNPSFAHTVPLSLIGLLIAPTITADTPIFRFLFLVLSLALVGLVTAMVVPTYSEQWPQPVSIHVLGLLMVAEGDGRRLPRV